MDFISFYFTVLATSFVFFPYLSPIFSLFGHWQLHPVASASLSHDSYQAGSVRVNTRYYAMFQNRQNMIVEVAIFILIDKLTDVCNLLVLNIALLDIGGRTYRYR